MRFVKLLIASLLTTSGLHAATLYVSPSGTDTNPGTANAPYLTIQRGLDNTFAGDTLFIREGAYYIDQQVRVKNSGTADNWVVIMGEPGKKVGIGASKFLFEKPAKSEGWKWMLNGSFHIEGVHFVKVENISVFDSHNAGFMVRGPGTSNIVLNNCKSFLSYNSGIGLWYVDSVTVTNCEIVGANSQEFKPVGQDYHREAPHEALSIAGCKYFEVAWNHVHMNVKEGIDCKEFSAHGTIHHNYCHNNMRVGIYVDSWFGLLENVEVYSNIVHDCEWGMCISSEGKGSTMRNVRLHNNLLYNNRHSGLMVSVLGNDEPRWDIYFYNNTLVGNSLPAHWSGKGGGIDVRTSNITNLYIFNNIVYDNCNYEIASYATPETFKAVVKEKNLVFKNNLIGRWHDAESPVGFFERQVYAIPADNCIVADPLFVNRRLHNFRVNEASPAINKSIRLGDFGSTGNLGADISALPNLDLFKY